MIAKARGSSPIATPNALATASAVMSSWVGPDPAGREDVVPARPQRVQRRHDLLLVVRNHPHLADLHAEPGDVFGDVADVAVLGSATENFVADDENGCCDGLRIGHASSSASA